MPKRHKHAIEQLTDVELEMMNIIWKEGPCTVNKILEILPKDRKLAYTSVSTMVRILEQKNFVYSQKDGRAHLYGALVKKDQYETRAVSDMITKVFDGQPKALVRRLLSGDLISQDTIRELKKLIEAEKKK